MQILDFLFENSFIVIVIAIAIFNLLARGSKKSQEQQQRQQQEQRQSQRQSQRQHTASSQRQAPTSRQSSQTRGHSEGNVLDRMAKKVEGKFEELSSQIEQQKPQPSIEQQQKKQFEQLQKEVRREYASHTEDEEHKSLKKRNVKETQTTHTHEIGDVELDQLMSKKGLVQGMIMSEVLGPPRALKPYRSVIDERRR